jgi:hypothetical protein
MELFMKCFLILGLLISSGLFAAPESYSFRGKNYSISYELKERYQEIKLNGVILSSFVEDHDGLKKVKKLLRPGVDIRLKLNSAGGLLSIFDDFSGSLRDACSYSMDCKITTYVESEDECTSACVPLFMVGDRRKAGESARFGFHTASALPGFGKIPALVQNDLIKNGVDESWLEMNKSLFDSLQVTILNPKRLEGSNIVTSIVE